MPDNDRFETRVLEPADFEALTPRFKEVQDYLAARARPGLLPRQAQPDGGTQGLATRRRKVVVVLL